jgi:hypothetical protein
MSRGWKLEETSLIITKNTALRPTTKNACLAASVLGVVELRRIELLTSTLPVLRSPS